jgi:TPR repeat protein
MSLGYLYEQGLGVPKNPEQAHNWYRRASGMKDFVPAEEASLNSLERQELDTLRKEVEKLKHDTDALRRQLEGSKQKLDDTRHQFEQRQNAMESDKIALQKKRRQLEKRKSSAVAGSRTELLDLDKKIAKREAELD